MSSLEIEDVLASIRRLVSDDLRPANRPHPIGKLMLTPALRVVPQAGVIDDATAPLDRVPDNTGVALPNDWVPDQTTLSAVSDQEADHLDFGGPAAMAAAAPSTRSAMQTAAEAFHAQTDEFILSYSDTGAFMLRGDAHASPPPSDHGAVFAVLNKASVPPVHALVDAEGGAPVEDEAAWSTVEWDDAPAASDSVASDPVLSDEVSDQSEPEIAPSRAEVVQDDAAKDGPLILSFVSARRAPVGSGAGLLTLRSPVVEVMDAGADRTSEDTPPEPLVLQRTKPKLKPKHLAARTAAEQEKLNSAKPDDETMDAAALDAAADFVEQNMATPTLTDTAFEAMLGRAKQPGSMTATGSDAANTDSAGAAFAATAPTDPAGSADHDSGVDTGSAKAVLADEATEADLPDMAISIAIASAMAAGPWSDRIGDDSQDDADDAPTGLEIPSAADQTVADAKAKMLTKSTPDATLVDGAASPAPRAAATSDASAKSLHLATSRTKPPAKLAEAAFTRWPGWAQPDPSQIAAADLSPPEPPAASEPDAADVRRKPKAAIQNLGWADRAEAEIHRQLAAELGPSVMGEVNTPSLDLQLSEAALRDLVRDMIREELTGKLGERITENVRKLVQMELQKSMSLYVTEFRSQRRDPG